jgi:hypothetical protein
VVVFPGGKVLHVQPRSPVLDLLKKLAVVIEGEDSLQGQAREAVNRAVYADIIRTLQVPRASHKMVAEIH